MLDKIKIFFLFLLIFLSTISLAISSDEFEPQLIESTKLKATTITASLEEPITQDKNLLYCSTFQIAWNQLIDDIIKEPIQLEGNPEIAALLNKRLTGKEDVSGDSYIAMAGFNKDGIAQKVIQALREKFNRAPGIDLNLENEYDILAYSFLFKDLKFKEEFESLDEPIMFKGVIPVQAFGIGEMVYDKEGKNAKRGSQVDILSYNNDDDFIISLKSLSLKDEIILAKINPKNTLLETVDYMLTRIKAPEILSNSSIRREETLRIPKLDFNLLHKYSEFSGKHFLNKDIASPLIYISKALQSVRFKLNEKGALLKSEAVLAVVSKGGFETNRIIRQFIFDKPFLICLKEKGAKYPYFVIWINNAELLLKR